jgi:hypothetical protein
MIQHWHFYQVAGVNESPGQLNIFRAGGRITTGVIMNNNQGCCIMTDASSENFSGANR